MAERSGNASLGILGASPFQGMPAPQKSEPSSAQRELLQEVPLRGQQAFCHSESCLKQVHDSRQSAHPNGGDLSADVKREVKHLDPEARTVGREQKHETAKRKRGGNEEGESGGNKKQKRGFEHKERRNFVPHFGGPGGKAAKKKVGSRRFTTGAKSRFEQLQKAKRKARWRREDRRHEMPAIIDDIMPEGEGEESAVAGNEHQASRLCTDLQATIEQARAEGMTDDALRSVLRLAFGWDDFRDRQLEVLNKVLKGDGRALAIMPTGSGKTLCYQLPSVLLDGVTLVVSPLIALMEDQLQKLPECLRGTSLWSGQPKEEAAKAAASVQNGEVDVVFLSPERLASPNFLEILHECPRKVSLVCIDEAHCVSEWSHNFRPSYFRLGRIVSEHVQPRSVLALTATATRKTEMEIVDTFNIPTQSIIRSGHLAANIEFSASQPLSREVELRRLLERSDEFRSGSVIVYCGFRNQCDTVAASLRAGGISALSYHAGLERSRREDIQRKFKEGKARVCVATVAFGMGLDKPDVRGVILHSPPRGPEALVQQAGRAGRDGHKARVHLVCSYDDYAHLRTLAFSDGGPCMHMNLLLKKVFAFVDRYDPHDDHVEEDDGQEEGGRACYGCLPIERTCVETDIQEQALGTPLCYLEQWGYIEMLPELTGSMCDIMFHQTSPEELSKTDAFANAVLRAHGKRQPTNGKYSVSVVDVANYLHASFHQFQVRGFGDIGLLGDEKLREMVGSGEMSCELRERAYAFKVIATPESLEEMDHLAASLNERMDAIEKASVGKLDATQELIANAVSAGDRYAQDDAIRSALNRHFGSEAEGERGEPEETIQEDPKYPVRSDAPGLKGDAATAIRALEMARKKGAANVTARVAARALHGQGSPAFPWKSASKALGKSLWGKHAEVDFRAVERAASACLGAGST